MTFTVEDGTGVAGANSYASVAFIDAYWADRPHLAEATVWAGLDVATKQGAAIEASQYLDNMLAGSYRGRRAGYIQGLEYPRMDALDDDGYDLPALPPQLQTAVAELSGRAGSGRLVEDQEVMGAIKRTREKIGPLEEEIEYAGGALPEKKFGLIIQSLSCILNGSQPGAAPQWTWR